MQDFHQQVISARQRAVEVQAQVEQARLAREARRARNMRRARDTRRARDMQATDPAHSARRRAALAQLGRWLVDTGQQLQARYGEIDLAISSAANGEA